MDREELLALDNSEIAKMLNDLIADGKSKDEACAELELTAADLTKQNIFWVKDKFLARAWSGYTSTKRSGNEYAQAGDGWRGEDVKDFKGREVPW
ncbi:MAG: hypothetical protein IJI68_12305 [Eggerthellaceae bacterium]|jgi:hypothetical protein|nr:hypothetical protein [Eggerthellaceae bacterium]